MVYDPQGCSTTTSHSAERARSFFSSIGNHSRGSGGWGVSFVGDGGGVVAGGEGGRGGSSHSGEDTGHEAKIPIFLHYASMKKMKNRPQ